MRYSVQTQNVIDEVAKPLNDFSKNAEQAAKKVFEKTKSAASQALELSDDVIEDGEDLFNKGVQRSVSLFKQYPIESAVVCLGAGFLVGKFLNRRH